MVKSFFTKLKIHLERGEIFQDNANTGKNFYNFFNNQEDETEKIVDLNLNLSGDLEYYIREILSGTTNDRLNFVKMQQQSFYFIDLIIFENRLVYQNSN